MEVVERWDNFIALKISLKVALLLRAFYYVEGFTPHPLYGPCPHGGHLP